MEERSRRFLDANCDDRMRGVGMTMQVKLTPEEQAGLLRQARESGLSLEAFAEQVLREKSHEARQQDHDSAYAESIRQLASFGKRHKLSLGGMSIAELLHESRP
jgi:hypothetical protein